MISPIQTRLLKVIGDFVRLPYITCVLSLFRRIFGRTPSKFFRDFATFQVANTVVLFIGLLTSLIQARFLGASGFGLLALASALGSLLTLAVNGGQETVLSTFLPRAFTRKNKQEISECITYFTQFTLLAVGIAALISVLLPLLSTYIGRQTSVIYLSLLVLWTAVIQAPFAFWISVLQSTQNSRRVSVIEVMRAVVQCTLLFILLRAGWGVLGALLSVFIVQIGSAFYVAYAYSTEYRRWNLPRPLEILLAVRSPVSFMLVRQGVLMTLDRSIAGNIFPNLFFVALHQVAGEAVVGTVRLALRLAQLPTSFLLPAMSRSVLVEIPRILEGSAASFKQQILHILRSTVGMMLAVLFGTLLLVPPLIPIIYGHEFTNAIWPFIFLLPTNVFTASSVCTVTFLRLIKRTSISLIHSLSSVSIGFGLFWLLQLWLTPMWAMVIAVNYIYAQSILLNYWTYMLTRSLVRSDALRAQ